MIFEVEDVKAVIESADGPMRFNVNFSGAHAQGFFELKTRVQDKWLFSGPGIRSDVAGWIMPFDCSLMAISAWTWEPVEKDCEYHLYSRDRKNPLDWKRLEYEMRQVNGIRQFIRTDVADVSFEAGMELCCFFDGDAFNPKLSLTLQTVGETNCTDIKIETTK